jgi:N-acetylmuramoyl-L-alanine amidase
MTGFNWSTIPVCLIEMGYMTNSEEDHLLATDEYRDKCAAGLAEGIEEWYLSSR